MIQQIFSKCHFVCKRRNESGRQRISETEDPHWHIHFHTSSFMDKKILDFMQETHCRTDHCCGVAATHSLIATPPGGWQYCRNCDNDLRHGTTSFLMLNKWTRLVVQKFCVLSLATCKIMKKYCHFNKWTEKQRLNSNCASHYKQITFISLCPVIQDIWCFIFHFFPSP